MKVTFSQIGGWSGGQWQFDGVTGRDFLKVLGIDPRPVKGMKATVTKDDRTHEVVIDGFRTISGVDHDHGHEYPWSYSEPTFLFEGNPFSIPASEIWRLGFTITLEVSDGSN